MTSRFFRTMTLGISLSVFLSGCAGSPPAHPIRAKAREHLSNAQELLMQNQPDQALSSVRKALKMHQLSNDFQGTIDDMNRLARLSYLLGKVTSATIWIDRALVLEGVSDFPEKKAETLILAAEIAPSGSSGPWIADARRLVGTLPSGSDESQRLEARLNQIEGLRASAKKDYQGAIPFFRKALSLDLHRNDRLSVASVRAGLARNFYLSGDYPHAHQQFLKALMIDEKLRNHSGIAYDLEGVSLAEASMGQYRSSAQRMLAAAGVETGLGRMKMAQRDISFSRTLFKNIKTPDAVRFQEILSHWFDPD